MAYTARLLIRDVVCIPATSTVAQAAGIMDRSNIGAVIVGTMAKPEGIFTERDVSRRVVAAGLDPVKTTAGSVMTKTLISIDAEAPLDKVFERLADGRFRHLPIAEKGRIVGIVSLTDLAKVLQEVYKEDKYLRYFADVVAAR